MNIEKIKSLLVSRNKRPSFLPKYFGKWMLTAEQDIYTLLSSFCKTYTGAYWNFYELNNGGFYLAPDLEDKLQFFVESNGYEGALSADAAGIVVTLYALNRLCCMTESEELIKNYYLLLDFANEHHESIAIFRAID